MISSRMRAAARAELRFEAGRVRAATRRHAIRRRPAHEAREGLRFPLRAILPDPRIGRPRDGDGLPGQPLQQLEGCLRTLGAESLVEKDRRQREHHFAEDVVLRRAAPRRCRRGPARRPRSRASRRGPAPRDRRSRRPGRAAQSFRSGAPATMLSRYWTKCSRSSKWPSSRKRRARSRRPAASSSDSPRSARCRATRGSRSSSRRRSRPCPRSSGASAPAPSGSPPAGRAAGCCSASPSAASSGPSRPRKRSHSGGSGSSIGAPHVSTRCRRSVSANGCAAEIRERHVGRQPQRARKALEAHVVGALQLRGAAPSTSRAGARSAPGCAACRRAVRRCGRAASGGRPDRRCRKRGAKSRTRNVRLAVSKVVSSTFVLSR